MLLFPSLNTPFLLDKDADASAQEGAIKYHFLHGQWEALEALSNIVEPCKLNSLAQAMLGIARKFHSNNRDDNAADILIHKAIDKGLDEESLNSLVIYDASITSARAFLIIGAEDSAIKEYRQAFKTLFVGDSSLFVEIRMFNDLVDLGCVERASEILQSKKKKLTHVGTREIKSSDSAKVILVAGMRHSGSTALFNLIRIGGLLSGLSVQSGYSEQVSINDIEINNYDLVILKTHERRDDIFDLADLIITTRRDLRDTVASGKRREFNMLTKLGVLEYAKYNRALHDIWSGETDFEFVYEDFMHKAEQTVKSLFEFLGLDVDLVQRTLEKVNNLPTDQYKRTLLSQTHITDKERNLTFKDSLSQDELAVINNQHRKWLQNYGYCD